MCDLMMRGVDRASPNTPRSARADSEAAAASRTPGRVGGAREEAAGAHRRAGAASGGELAELIASAVERSAEREASAKEGSDRAQAGWTARASRPQARAGSARAS